MDECMKMQSPQLSYVLVKCSFLYSHAIYGELRLSSSVCANVADESKIWHC